MTKIVFPAQARGPIERTVGILGGVYGDTGRIFGADLAVAHTLRCTKRLHYDNHPVVRVRRNLIIYGPRGCGKSTISKFFLSHMTGGFDITDPANKDRFGKAPAVMPVSSGSTWERLRGSLAPDGSIIPPLIQKADWIYATELMSFLGHTPTDRAKRIEDLNMAFEEGRMVVGLVKAFNMDLEERIKVAEALPVGCGYTYDPEGAFLSYDARSAFLGCSRFLPPKLLHEELEPSGYWSRHAISEVRMGDGEARIQADKKFGPPPNANELEACRNKWLDLWNTEFGQVNFPPVEMVDEVVAWFNVELSKVAHDIDRRFTDLYSARDDTNVAQLLTVAAIERISASRAIGDRSRIESVGHLPSDIHQAKRWLGTHLAHLRNSHGKGRTEADAASVDKAFTIFTDFIMDLRSQEHPLTSFNSSEWAAFFAKKKLGGDRTARRHLRQLKEEGFAVAMAQQPGEYSIDDGVFERLQIESPNHIEQEAPRDDGDEEEHHEERHYERDLED